MACSGPLHLSSHPRQRWQLALHEGAARSAAHQHGGTQIVAVEPTESPVISGGKPGPHKIQGIGAGFIPGNLDMSLIDETIQARHLMPPKPCAAMLLPICYVTHAQLSSKPCPIATA